MVPNSGYLGPNRGQEEGLGKKAIYLGTMFQMWGLAVIDFEKVRQGLRERGSQGVRGELQPQLLFPGIIRCGRYSSCRWSTQKTMAHFRALNPKHPYTLNPKPMHSTRIQQPAMSALANCSQFFTFSTPRLDALAPSLWIPSSLEGHGPLRFGI